MIILHSHHPWTCKTCSCLGTPAVTQHRGCQDLPNRRMGEFQTHRERPSTMGAANVQGYIWVGLGQRWVRQRWGPSQLPWLQTLGDRGRARGIIPLARKIHVAQEGSGGLSRAQNCPAQRRSEYPMPAALLVAVTAVPIPACRQWVLQEGTCPAYSCSQEQQRGHRARVGQSKRP